MATHPTDQHSESTIPARQHSSSDLQSLLDGARQATPTAKLSARNLNYSHAKRLIRTKPRPAVKTAIRTDNYKNTRRIVPCVKGRWPNGHGVHTRTQIIMVRFPVGKLAEHDDDHFLVTCATPSECSKRLCAAFVTLASSCLRRQGRSGNGAAARSGRNHVKNERIPPRLEQLLHHQGCTKSNTPRKAGACPHFCNKTKVMYYPC
jgi:hypothetical protein